MVKKGKKAVPLPDEETEPQKEEPANKGEPKKVTIQYCAVCVYYIVFDSLHICVHD